MMCCSLPFRLHLLVSNSHDHDLIQVGDRWHLLNLLETLIKLLEHYRGTMREVARLLGSREGAAVRSPRFRRQTDGSGPIEAAYKRAAFRSLSTHERTP